ncbi:chemotaxis protein CheX [Desulfopila sp. IMCC35006]|uniref:chemotaxis protein CheX n=1 Tax=Desulfopila sp. IMCC35006 TaxID=2569542 RepID=UPI001F102EA6|nr:chemotaxis protein CheX [Desulfopila sp. IMCC35006]
MDISDKIIESAKEIFATMVMMEITVNGHFREDSIPLTDSISGVIGLAGTYKGVLAVHMPSKVAMAVTGSFLGMEINEMNADVEDAVGELANMLGGNVKSILSDNGRDIDLSLPSTIIGKQYDFQPTREAERVIIPFACPAGEFAIDLQLEK